jgi:signal transduction histidine kinase
VAFVAITLLAAAALSWLAYRSVRTAMETQFARRLEGIAATGAAQVSPDDVADARLLGEEGSGYIALQVLLEQLRATSGAAHVAVLDSARTVIYDTRGPERSELETPLDSLARDAVDRAYQGHPAVSDLYAGPEGPLRAGLAPVTREGRVAAVVVAEARPDYGADLGRLGRSLWLTTLVIGLALATLGAVIFRMAWSAVRLERRLSRAENLAAMGRLTATLAHEIKNPLAIIRGSAQRLGRLAPEAQRMADNVVEETDRLSRTVARYLQFARPDAEGGGRGDAVAALDATLGLLEGELKARNVTLRRSPGGPSSAPVRLDAESLRQVYLNLLLNAIEAMPEGGSLEIGASESRGKVEVTIADSGRGIAPEALRDLGQPFATTKAQGSGLGLFLTRRLLESAGGLLEIESEPGRGTRCRVRLPRSQGTTERLG